MQALRKRSVPQADSQDHRNLDGDHPADAHGSWPPPDQRKVRGKVPGLIYAFRDEAGTWWPRGHERLLPDEYAVGLYLLGQS